MSTPAEPDTSTSRPVLGRQFLVVWAGQTVSTVGSGLSGMGIAVFVFVTTGSLAWLGALTALATLPVLVTAPFLDLTDRFDRRVVMITADCVAAIGPAIALLLAVAGELQPWHLAAAGFVGGLGSAFQSAAYQASIPHLVTPDAIGRANGLVQLAPAAAIVIGPAIATPIVAAWGIEAVLIVDMATFLVGVGATALTRFSARPEPAEGDDRSMWTAIRWLRGPGRGLLVLIAVMAGVNFFLAFFNIAVLALAVDLGGIGQAGPALAVGGVAMIISSLVMGHLGVPSNKVRALRLALTVMAVGCIVSAARPSFAVVVVGLAVALASVPVGQAVTSTLFHQHVPDAMLGRVSGLRFTVGHLLYPLGSLLAGFVGGHVLEPAMSPGGTFAGSIGSLVGVGPGRGAAAMMLIVGVALMAMTIPLMASRSLHAIDHDEPAAKSAEPFIKSADEPTEVPEPAHPFVRNIERTSA